MDGLLKMNSIKYHSPVEKKEIIILPKFKVAYINSPKNACTTIKTILAEADGLNFITKNYKDIHEAHYSLNFFKHLSFDEIPKNYFKFTCIRNPFDRIVSFYTHKIMRNKYNKILKYYGIDKHNKKEYQNNFKNFIDLLYERKNFELHLAHQTTALHIEKLDYIIRFEDFNNDFKKICNHIHYKGKIYHKMKSNHRKYQEYYDKESRKKIEELYYKDLKELYYEF